jgi:hypothetical protein
MKTQRVLPADVYDTLEFSALVYGGIGAGWTVDSAGIPLCVIGHADQAVEDDWMDGPVVCALWCVGMSGSVNDGAVGRINERKGAPENTRVTFAEWCEELGIVRGE